MEPGKVFGDGFQLYPNAIALAGVSVGIDKGGAGGVYESAGPNPAAVAAVSVRPLNRIPGDITFMVMYEEIRAGSEVDATCTRCRMVTNHRVVAMHEGVIKRVICLTCESQHNFRPPPGRKKSEQVVARRSKGELETTVTTKTTTTQKSRSGSQSRTKTTTKKRATPVPTEEWLRRKEALAEEPRPYRMTETYQAGEALDHPKFGLGFIIRIGADGKMEVLFESSLKTLVSGYSS